MKLLEGKTALVTGATRGIGRAIAVKFAQEGANVVFTYRQINSNAEELIKEIEALGVKCKGYAADAADYAATEEVVKDVAADFGRKLALSKPGFSPRRSHAFAELYTKVFHNADIMDFIL